MVFFNDRRGQGLLMINDALGQIQAKRTQDEQTRKAYLAALMQGQPYERRLEVLRSNPGLAGGMNLPNYQPTTEEQLADLRATQGLDAQRNFKPDAGTTQYLGAEGVLGRAPNKEATNQIYDRQNLTPQDYTSKQKIDAGLQLNAKDAVLVPTEADKNTAAAGKDRAETAFTAGPKTRLTGAQTGEAGARADEASANAQFTRGAKTTTETKQGGLYDAESAAATAKAKGETGANYGAERKQRMLDSVNDLLPRVGNSTVGAGAMFTAKIPGTAAKDFGADLEKLKANIAFNELQEMRNASKTGGALGQVSDKEGTLLQSALAALDQFQSPDNFRKNLNNITASLQRWEQAKATMGGATAPASAGGGSNTISLDEWLTQNRKQ